MTSLVVAGSSTEESGWQQRARAANASLADIGIAILEPKVAFFLKRTEKLFEKLFEIIGSPIIGGIVPIERVCCFLP